MQDAASARRTASTGAQVCLCVALACCLLGSALRSARLCPLASLTQVHADTRQAHGAGFKNNVFDRLTAQRNKVGQSKYKKLEQVGLSLGVVLCSCAVLSCAWLCL